MVSTRGVKLETPTSFRKPANTNTNKDSDSQTHGNDDTSNKKGGSSSRKSSRDRGAPAKYQQQQPSSLKRKAISHDNDDSKLLNAAASKKVKIEDEKKVNKATRIHISLHKSLSSKPVKLFSSSASSSKSAVKSSKKETMTTAAATVKSEDDGKEISVSIRLLQQTEFNDSKKLKAVLHFPLLSCQIDTSLDGNNNNDDSDGVGGFTAKSNDGSKSGKKGRKKRGDGDENSNDEGGNNRDKAAAAQDAAPSKVKSSTTKQPDVVQSSTDYGTTATAAAEEKRNVQVSIRIDGQLFKNTCEASLSTSTNIAMTLEPAAAATANIDPSSNHIINDNNNESSKTTKSTTTSSTKTTKLTTPKQHRCKYPNCNKYRQGYTGGYCLTHKTHGLLNSNFASPDEAATILAAISTSTSHRETMEILKETSVKRKLEQEQMPKLTGKIPSDSHRCKYEGCYKYRQGYTGGYCLTHKEFGTGKAKADDYCVNIDDGLEQGGSSVVDGVVASSGDSDAVHPHFTRHRKPKEEPKKNKKNDTNNNATKNPDNNASDDDTKLPPLPPDVEELNTKVSTNIPGQSKQCIVEGCVRYKRSRNGGYCLAHKYLWDGIEEPAEIKIAPAGQQCRVEGCVKYKRSCNGGFCLAHKHLWNGVDDYKGEQGKAVVLSLNGTAGGGAASSSLPPLPGSSVPPLPGVELPLPPNIMDDHAMDVSTLLDMDAVERDCAAHTSFLDMDAYDDLGHLSIPLSNHDETSSVRYDVDNNAAYHPALLPSAVSAPLENEVADANEVVGIEQNQSVIEQNQSNEGDNNDNTRRKDPPEQSLKMNASANHISASDGNTKPAAATASVDRSYLNAMNDEDTTELNAADAFVKSSASSMKKDEEPTAANDSDESTTSNHHPPQAKLPALTLPPGMTLKTPSECKTNGRSYCKVAGCKKLDQSGNKGFCRSHYNLVYADVDREGSADPWICHYCGLEVEGIKTRCGNCFRWKGGVRLPYNHTNAKREKVECKPMQREKTEIKTIKTSTGEALSEEYWTCSECGNQVDEHKSRCGVCHHWRGGKRVGGWKLGEKATAEDFDQLTDWECCGEIIPARKSRCGKCRGWRGGKRLVRWSYEGPPEENSNMVDDTNVDYSIDWRCTKCTNMNKGKKKRCAECGSWRFSRKKKSLLSAPSLPSNEEETTEGGHWICQGCNYDNFASEIKCLMCQKYRPNWKKYSQGFSSKADTTASAESTTQLDNTTAPVSGADITSADGIQITDLEVKASDIANQKQEKTTVAAHDLATQDTVNTIESAKNEPNIDPDVCVSNNSSSTGFASNPTLNSGASYLDNSLDYGGSGYGNSYLHNDYLDASASNGKLESHTRDNTSRCETTAITNDENENTDIVQV